jgi:hypothetical protein
MKKFSIFLMCYSMADNALDKISIIDEKGYLKAIEIESEEEYSSLSKYAIDKIKFDYGLDVEKNNLKYLGKMTRNEDHVIYSFALDVTDTDISIKMYDLNIMKSVTDVTCQALYLRLFSFLFKQECFLDGRFSKQTPT